MSFAQGIDDSKAMSLDAERLRAFNVWMCRENVGVRSGIAGVASGLTE